jgi:hypothetical protein
MKALTVGSITLVNKVSMISSIVIKLDISIKRKTASTLNLQKKSSNAHLVQITGESRVEVLKGCMRTLLMPRRGLTLRRPY